ncbi:MAG TPA: SRPBCC family protein, partial [Acidimicrobiales bacterium]|nr:SRPBCC family protein [Acidimicrobiales bacterium]
AAMHAAVTLHIDAEPDKVWGLVTDITRMGEYSPEVIEAEWMDGATGPALGARYRGHVRRNEKWPVYWTTCQVTECTPGEVFEFAVLLGERPVNTWRYEFKASEGGGTDVTESFDLGDNLFMKVWRPLGGILREKRNQRDMLHTLQQIKKVAEAS